MGCPDGYIPTTGIVIMERSALGELRFDSKRLGTDDWAMWLQMAMRHPIAFRPERLVRIRMLPQSLGNRKGPMIADMIGLLVWVEPLIGEKDAEVTSREKARYYYRWASMLLDGGRKREALCRWWQATKLGLDAKYHRNFLGKLALGALGDRHRVERILWYHRMKAPGGSRPPGTR